MSCIGLRLIKNYCIVLYCKSRRDVPVGVPIDLSTEWHELPKYNGIQVSQLIYIYEPRHEKTIVLVFDQVRQKQGCTVTEDS